MLCDQLNLIKMEHFWGHLYILLDTWQAAVGGYLSQVGFKGILTLLIEALQYVGLESCSFGDNMCWQYAINSNWPILNEPMGWEPDLNKSGAGDLVCGSHSLILILGACKEIFWR